MSRAPLPIDAVLPHLVSALERERAAVLRAPTGAGKTTRVPQALLDAGLAGSGRVVVLEPRRLAARAAARRIAFERGGRVGDEVGYRVRFDRKESARTRILVVTEGLFVRQLQEDPFLEGVGAVVLDEFHERNLEGDLALAMLGRVRAEARPELPIVVMSATLEPAPIAAWLSGAVVESEGRLHPVAVSWLDPREARDESRRGRSAAELARRTARGVERALGATSGDVLVFLPGVGEIRRAKEELADLAARRDLALPELYGDLSPREQDAALCAGPRRRVVLATNVAETSVTVEGVTAVVDSGLARVLRHDPGVGLDRLELTRVSAASADQRSGRAGRTAPGIALRLWTEAEQRSLRAAEEPAIRRVDLAGAWLELACWGETDPARFAWFEPPPAAHLARARTLLERLGAIDHRGPTALGRAMARLPVHPRLARLLVAGRELGVSRDAALAAALLAERDPLARSSRDREGAAHPSSSDVVDRVHALRAFEENGRRHGAAGAVEPAAARFVLRARDQLERLAAELDGPAPAAPRTADEALMRALLAAWPDRLARRRAAGDRRAVMLGGRGVRLHPSSAVADAELFLCVAMDAGRTEGVVRLASAVRREWLDPARLRDSEDLAFDPEGERVVASRRTLHEDLVLDEVSVNVRPGERASAVLAEAAAADLDRSLELSRPAVSAFLARVRSLAAWRPELDLPRFDEADLRALLPDLCHGLRSFAELRRAPLLDHLRARLGPERARALDREAPERLRVPSGSRIALDYTPGEPPVLAVRIQEVFGLTETPRVAGGRVPVLLHLLAPNGRPQQVTTDLGSFWRETYHVVRKELRRRYPKHAWPEDPLAAQPRSRPGR